MQGITPSPYTKHGSMWPSIAPSTLKGQRCGSQSNGAAIGNSKTESQMQLCHEQELVEQAHTCDTV
jgi:hypothetical protein